MRKKGLILLWIISILFSSVITVQADDQELEKTREAIKSTGAKWQANETSISRLSPEERRALLGGLPEEVAPRKMPAQRSGVALPSHFDWRDHNGYNWMTSVKNQPCSNCWAYASVGAFEAMIKIESNRPNLPVDLSEKFVTWCGKGSCTPWYLSSTLNVLMYMGVPDQNCLLSSACSDTCEDRFFRSAFVSSWGYTDPIVSSIKERIYNYGPVAVWMMVYTDFYYYSGGVYQHTSGVEEGGHFVVICGWDDTENYWICKNSWGIGWGEAGGGQSGGWFRIRMGTNEAGIEEWVYAMNTDLSSVAERIGVKVPNGGEVYVPGDDVYIKWASSFFYDNVKIEYSINNGSTWYIVTSSTPDDGGFNWVDIPDSSSMDCKVRISDAADGNPWDTSDSTFSILFLGDANCDGNIDVVDVVYLVNYAFKMGPEPIPLKSGDAFCDGQINVQDVVFLVNYVFKGGPKPQC